MLCTLTFLVLIGRSQALFFELQAGDDAECFKTGEVLAGHRIAGTYEADGAAEGGVEATLLDSFGKQLWHGAKPSGNFEAKIEHKGVHTLCFKNLVKDKQTVSFNMQVDNHVDKELVTRDHAEKVKSLITTLESSASKILEQQQFGITREAVQQGVAESTNSRVMWWTIVEVIFLISVTAFQVYYLQSHFEVKQVI